MLASAVPWFGFRSYLHFAPELSMTGVIRSKRRYV
ncbi:unnamed protein product [Amoebophrya sp. A120]|nr:unnamed protein product [Amoebophrya sp. A120]|eukprot:GSA120T00009311001.1